MNEEELRYHVMHENGTEHPFSGKELTSGTYVCAECRRPLFTSYEKFESGSGWPSFYDTVKNAVELKPDGDRIEVCCRGCNCHLGHVFSDGPPPTGKRYCINSICLEIE